MQRAGIVKDWVTYVSDIAFHATHKHIEGVDHISALNPIGLGVARAYQTSELSRISGMRIIISAEVIQDINPSINLINGVEVYSRIANIYVGDTNNIQEYKHEFKFYKIDHNDNNEPTEFYELDWLSEHDNMLSGLDFFLDCKDFYDKNNHRHYKKTIEFLNKSILANQDFQSSNLKRFRALRTEFSSILNRP